MLQRRWNVVIGLEGLGMDPLLSSRLPRAGTVSCAGMRMITAFEDQCLVRLIEMIMFG